MDTVETASRSYSDRVGSVSIKTETPRKMMTGYGKS